MAFLFDIYNKISIIYFYSSILHYAVEKNDVDMVERLLKFENIDVNVIRIINSFFLNYISKSIFFQTMFFKIIK